MACQMLKIKLLLEINQIPLFNHRLINWMMNNSIWGLIHQLNMYHYNDQTFNFLIDILIFLFQALFIADFAYR